ncbi:MAG: hypothetical protein AAFV98_14095 [Chloroflexota bacterium]
MKSIFRFSLTLTILLLFTLSISAQEVLRQGAIPVQCGNIIEAEFTSNFTEQNYEIDLEPGTALNVSLIPLGSGLETDMVLVGPTGVILWIASGYPSGNGAWLQATTQPTLETDTLGSRGIHTIKVFNFTEAEYRQADGSYWSVGANDTTGTGVYSLFIGCTLRDGTIIEPGDSLPETTTTTDSSSDSAPTSAPAFSGFGFPGLVPVDFSTVARIPIPAGVALSGAITPTGSEILGYVFEASEGDTVALDFARLSGNLNLGLVVIDADSNVIFQTSMVTGDTLSTTFTIPTSGEYTAGVFRLDLLPPVNPEATAFQVTATVNP